MKTKFALKTLLIIFALLLCGVLPAGVKNASADGTPPGSVGNILANPQSGYVELGNCPIDVEFTLTVFDGRANVYTSYPPTPCIQRDDGYNYAAFQVVEYTMKVGDLLTVSSENGSKALVITPEGTHAVDLAADTVQGVDEGASHLFVTANDTLIDVYAGSDGSWLAEFSGIVDLVPGMMLAVYREDSDGDYTNYYWYVPDVRLEVHPYGDLVYALGWQFDDELVMTINDSQGKFLDEFSVIVGEFPWNSEVPAGDFSPFGFDFQPGQMLTVSGAGVTMTYRIPDPKVTHFDAVADTISGTGTPGTQMLIAAVLPAGEVYRWATVDEAGNWMVNYVPTDYPGDGEADLLPSSHGWADEFDVEGNQTWADDWVLPMPSSGRVVGEGWFVSPAGAYTDNPEFTGKAILEFNAKYLKKSPILNGSVVFAFKGFHFQSTSLEWLVIEGGRMQLTGNGTINGKGNYGFMIDAANNPPGYAGKDTFRIRIWDQTSEEVVYDNMPGEADYVIPITPVEGGMIELKP